MSASKLDPVKSGAIYRVVPGSKEYLAMTSPLPRQASSNSQRQRQQHQPPLQPPWFAVSPPTSAAAAAPPPSAVSQSLRRPEPVHVGASVPAGRSVSERFLALVQASPMPRVLRQAHEIGVSSAPFLTPATLWDAVQPPARPLRSPSSLDTIAEQLPDPGSAARGHNTVPAYQRQVMMASPQSTPAAAPRQRPHSCEQAQRHEQQQCALAAVHGGAADVAAALPYACAAEQCDFATPQQPVRAPLQAGSDACLDAAAATSAASAAHAIAAAPSPLQAEQEQAWEAEATGGERGRGDTVDDRVLYPEGTAVRRQFVEGWFNGQVVLRRAVNSENSASTAQQQQQRVLWRVLYTDGDSEDLQLEDMHEMVANYATWSAATRSPLLEPKVEADDAADDTKAAAAAAAALAAPATEPLMPAAGARSAVASSSSSAAAALSPPAAAAVGTHEVVLRDWCITMSPLPRNDGSSSIRNLQNSGVAQPKYYIHGFVDAGSSTSNESAAAAIDDTSGDDVRSSYSRSSAPVKLQVETRIDQHTVATVGGARYGVRGAPSDAGAAARPPPHGALFAVRSGVPMQWRRAVSRAYERAAAAAEAAASTDGQERRGGDRDGDVQLPTGTIAGRLRNKAGSSTPASTSRVSKTATQSTVSRKPGADATMPSAHGSATKKKPAAGKASAAAPPSASADKQASVSKVSRKGGAVATKANNARSSTGLAALVAVKPEPQEVAAAGAWPAALSTSRSSNAGRKSATKAAAAAAAAATASHCSASSRKTATKAPKSQKQRLSAAAATPVTASKKPSKKGSSHGKGGGGSTGHAAGASGGGGINSGGGGGDESGVKVTCTRSGRKRVPVLEWWRSQRLSVGQDSSAELLSPTPMKPRLTSATSTGKRRRSQAPAVKQEPQESTSKRRKGATEGDEWTEQQEALLQQAQLRTDPGHANFWVQVAKSVPGKSASQCSQRWFAQVEEHNDGAGGTGKGNEAGAKRKRGKSAAATPSAEDKPAASAVKTAQAAPKGGKRGQTRAAAIASYLSSQAGHMDDVFQDSGGAQGKKKRKLSVPGVVSLPPNTLGATVPTPKVQGKTGKAGKSPANARQSQAGGNVSKSYMVAVSKRMRKQPPPKAGAIMVKAKRPKAAKAVTTTTAAGAGYKLKGMVSSGGAVRLEEQAASSSEYDGFANESGSESDTE